MGITLPSGVFLPMFWAFYFVAGGVATLLALVCLTDTERLFQKVLAIIAGLLLCVQWGALALAVRREGMAPAQALRAAFLPSLPLYAVILAPLGLTLLGLVAVATISSRKMARQPAPDTVEVNGETYAVAPEAARLYRKRALVHGALANLIATVLITLVVLDLNAGWVQDSVFALLVAAYLVPWLSDHVFLRRLRPYERLAADLELLSAVRAVAEPLGVTVHSAVVDASPQGRANVFLSLRGGRLTVSHRFLEDTNANERDFLLRRAVRYAAARDDAATARAWVITTVVCLGICAAVVIPPMNWWRTPFVAILGVVAMGVLPLVLLLLWLGAKRRRAGRAWLLAGNEALADTHNAEAALAAVERYAGPYDEPGSINIMLFDPLPAKDAQSEALRQEGARLGILPPDPPTAKGNSSREVPVEPV